MNSEVRLTSWERVTIPVALGKIAFAMIRGAIEAPFRGEAGASTFKKHVLYVGMRAVVENVSIRQYQALNPSTLESYKAFAKQRGFEPKTTQMPDGTTGCWLGDTDASTIMVWFHGGGYAYSASKEYMDFLETMVAKTNGTETKLAVFIVQYDLAPQAKYPRQLQQAVGTIEYLTQELGKSYSQLLVGGDSAGAHMTLGLMSHMLHPHPSVRRLDMNGQILKGALLLSPWATFAQTARSFLRNKLKCGLSQSGLKAWSDAFMGTSKVDNYNNPLGAQPNWWHGSPVGRIIIVGGQDELIVDDIEQLAQNMKQHNESKIDVFISPGECHNPPITERQLGIHSEDGAIESKVYQWVVEMAQGRP